MLQRVLALIHTGKAGTQKRLAAQLGVPEALIIQMLETLVSQGYLIEAETCAGGCGGCSLKPACETDRETRLWSLTDKGQRAAVRAASSVASA